MNEIYLLEDEGVMHLDFLTFSEAKAKHLSVILKKWKPLKTL